MAGRRQRRSGSRKGQRTKKRNINSMDGRTCHRVGRGAGKSHRMAYRRRLLQAVYDDLQRATGPARFDGVRRIGTDETSFKKGHRYLMVVVDHDRGCLVWAAEGWSKEVLRWFLKEELTREQGLGIEVVTADGCRWIKTLVERWLPQCRMGHGPLPRRQLDERRPRRRTLRGVADGQEGHQGGDAEAGCPGRPAAGDETPPEALKLAGAAKAIKRACLALVKGRENLTNSQKAKLDKLRSVIESPCSEHGSSKKSCVPSSRRTMLPKQKGFSTIRSTVPPTAR